MSPGLRLAVYGVFGALWASGCGWLALHWFFGQPGPFGTVQNPWAPAVLRLHGWAAVGGVFLLGWLVARHISDRWPQGIRRASGVAIAGVAGILALSGYALYYTTDGPHDVAALVHQTLGALAVLFALMHWRRFRPRGRDQVRSPATESLS